MKIQAELSLYPLFQQDVVPVVNNYIDCLKEYDIKTTVGKMSTHIKGELEEVFNATKSAYEKISSNSKCVLVAKFLNVFIE